MGQNCLQYHRLSLLTKQPVYRTEQNAECFMRYIIHSLGALYM